MKMPKRLTHLSWKKLGDFTLILDSQGLNQAHQLNEVGGIIWEQCDGEKTIEDTCDFLMQNFQNSTKAKVIEDIHFYIDQLKSKKLVE